MPPKKDQKKQIVKAFEPQPFWKYQQPSPENAQKANQFLTTFEKQLKELISPDKSFNENYQVICQKMGIAVHPCFRNDEKQQSNFPELKNNDYGEKYVQILNYKVDCITIKVITLVMSVCKLNSLKLSRNQIDNQAQDVKKMLQKQDSLTTLFFEWNPLENVQIRKDVFLMTVRPTIQHLVLRENSLGDQIFKQLIIKIKSMPEICLKSLDVSGNNLTKQVGDVICNFVQEEKNIEFLGLSRNDLHSKSFYKKLFESIGEIPLSQEDFAKHQEAVKARDEVIQRNKKKKKGAADEPVPFVLQVKQTQEGRFFVKNTSLQMIGLSKNAIGDLSAPFIKNFAEGHGKKVQLFLDGNKFTRKQKQIFKMIQNLMI